MATATEQMEAAHRISRSNAYDGWCGKCGAAPREACTVTFGYEDETPGDVRDLPHDMRPLPKRPTVLVKDEPPYAPDGDS